MAAPTPAPLAPVPTTIVVTGSRIDDARQFARSRPRALVWTGAGAAVLAVVLVLVLVTGGDSSSGVALGAVGSNPEELSDARIDGKASPEGRIGNLLVATVAPNDYSDVESVIAVDIETGNDEWEEDGDAAAVVGDVIVIGVDDELQRFDTDGKAVGEPLRLDGDVGEIEAAGSRLLVSTSDGVALVDAARWDVLSDDVGLVSANLRHFAEIDFRDDEYRIQRIDPDTGDRVGSRLVLDQDADDVELLGDGRLAVLEDDDVAIFNAEGEEVASFSGPRDSDRLVAAASSYLLVGTYDESTLFRISGNDIEELSPEIEGGATFLQIGGNTFVVSRPDDGESLVSKIGADGPEDMFDVKCDYWVANSTGLYVFDDEQLDLVKVPGDGKSVWSIDRDDDEYFEVVERLIVRVAYDSYEESTDLTLLG